MNISITFVLKDPNKHETHFDLMTDRSWPFVPRVGESVYLVDEGFDRVPLIVHEVEWCDRTNAKGEPIIDQPCVTVVLRPSKKGSEE